MPYTPKLPRDRSIWSENAAANAREADGMWKAQYGGAPRARVVQEGDVVRGQGARGGDIDVRGLISDRVDWRTGPLSAESERALGRRPDASPLGRALHPEALPVPRGQGGIWQNAANIAARGLARPQGAGAG
ncbi:MAG: hypothetical protein IK066_04565, partial [Kiritimatiellae bacterium]|nr:hypothetical protein [Kiritimatiellia bacterium]